VLGEQFGRRAPPRLLLEVKALTWRPRRAANAPRDRSRYVAGDEAHACSVVLASRVRRLPPPIRAGNPERFYEEQSQIAHERSCAEGSRGSSEGAHGGELRQAAGVLGHATQDENGRRRVNAALTQCNGWSDENKCLRDLAMLLEHRVLPEDKACPVADQNLGEIYRASPRGLNDVIATVSPTATNAIANEAVETAEGEWIGTALTVLFATAGVLFFSFLAVWTSLT
jgi:hypothetical protein